jgi:porcupine-like protein
MAYRDALSFRFSHYFICCLSEMTLTMTGHGGTKSNGDTRWDLSTTRVIHIEFPRSLVEVVTNWHLPMHHWLKTYVFKTARPMGNFAAILLTYVASSVLHGINFQLSAVLLSLGVYTYIEYSLRKRLSEAFSACIQARRCKADCQHTAKSTNVYVIIANVSFSLLAMFHLAYLGLMFDNSDEQEEGYSMEHTLSKWYHLGFASHWVAAASYFFFLLI